MCIDILIRCPSCSMGPFRGSFHPCHAAANSPTGACSAIEVVSHEHLCGSCATSHTSTTSRPSTYTSTSSRPSAYTSTSTRRTAPPPSSAAPRSIAVESSISQRPYQYHSSSASSQSQPSHLAQGLSALNRAYEDSPRVRNRSYGSTVPGGSGSGYVSVARTVRPPGSGAASRRSGGYDSGFADRDGSMYIYEAEPDY